MRVLEYMGKALLIALMVLGACKVGYGQTVVMTGPITTNDTVEWTVSPADAASASIAQSLPARFRDNGQSTFVPLTATSCVAATAPATGWTCTTKVTTQLASLVNVRGTHSLVLTLFDPTAGVEGSAAVPFALSTPAGAPTGVRIIR